MTRPSRILTVVLAALSLRAADVDRAEIKGIGNDAAAIGAYRLVERGRLIDAREKAEEILRARPDSYAAEYLLGYVLHEAEGNLPLALYHLRRARSLFEARHGGIPSAEDPWRWHAWALEELIRVNGEMDRFEEQLRLIDERNRVYEPDWIAERGWPLMRLRRYAEARSAIARSVTSAQPEQVSIALTALAAVEWETQNRAGAYKACIDALEFGRKTKELDPVLFTNAASSAVGLLRFDEAERLLVEGTNHFEAGTTCNPWLDLAELYLGEGRTAEALECARRMLSWQAAQPPYLDEQTRAAIEAASANMLLISGRIEAASVASRVADRPDRTGYTSAESERSQAATMMLDRRANLLAAEIMAERAACSPWKDWVAARFAEARYRLRAWAAGRRVAALIAQHNLLDNTLRPYLAGSASPAEWMEGDLIAVMGAGVITSAILRARAREQLPGAAAYFDALMAETLLHRGQEARAIQFAERAMEGLSRAEALLRARAAAVAFAAASELGDRERASAFALRAYQLDPGVFRRLDLALPCRLVAAEAGIAHLAERMLRQSPRLDDAGGGFTVEVEGGATSGGACLKGPHGETLACAFVTARAGEKPEDTARRLALEFHARAFAPRVDLSQADIRSLDGSTTTSAERAARQIEGFLDRVTGGGS